MSEPATVRYRLDDLNAAIALFAGTLWPLPASENHDQRPPVRGKGRHLTLVSGRPAISEPWATGKPDR